MEKQGMKKTNRPYYNVQYIIVEKVTNKVLKVETHEVKSYDVCKIGCDGIDLGTQYWNSYVMIKIY